MYDAATLAEMQMLRQKIASGQELSLEESKRAVALVRAGRSSVTRYTGTGKAKKTPIIDVKGMLDDLKGL